MVAAHGPVLDMDTLQVLPCADPAHTLLGRPPGCSKPHVFVQCWHVVLQGSIYCSTSACARARARTHTHTHTHTHTPPRTHTQHAHMHDEH